MRWNKSSTDALYYWGKALGVALAVLMFIVWEHVQARHLKRQLDVMHKEEDQLVFQNAKMQSQINQWISPSYLETMARKQLQMMPVDAERRIGLPM
jgi:cell division protein FtsL